MPTYEYHCDACHHDFEKFQQMSAEPIKVCPECGKKKVRRLIGAGGGLLFKGSGFYQTDYRSSNYKQAASSDKASSGGSCSAASKDSACKGCPKNSGGGKESA